MKKLFLLSVIAALLLSTATYGQITKTWTGSNNSSWTNAFNWSPIGAPMSGDNAVIPAGTPNQPVVSGVTHTVCNNLLIQEGATLTIAATSSNEAILTVNGATGIYGALAINGYTQFFPTPVQHTARLVTGDITWFSSSAFSALTPSRIELNGDWQFSDASNVNLGICGVLFTGSDNSVITSNSKNSRFGSVGVEKTGDGQVSIDNASTNLLSIGSLNILSGLFRGTANITTRLRGNLTNNGHFQFTNGTVSLEGTASTQQIQINNGDYFNHLNVNSQVPVELNNDLTIKGNFSIQSGTFNPNNHTLTVWGNWSNMAGPEHFIEGDGTVIFRYVVNKEGQKFANHEINYSENFNNLVMQNYFGGHIIINDPSAVVTCNNYDWEFGGVIVQAGAFTANNLVQNGIYGYFEVDEGGMINLSNHDGFVDLNGTINIAGGYFNVFGGTTTSWWPGSSNASLTMNGGVLDFKNQGIMVKAGQLNLTSDITGGTIRTVGSFINQRHDFEPTGGFVELYSASNATLYSVTPLHSISINKIEVRNGDGLQLGYDRLSGRQRDEPLRAQKVTLNTHLTVNGELNVESATLFTNGFDVVTYDHVNVNDGGMLEVNGPSHLKMGWEKYLNINAGGWLKTYGEYPDWARITRSSDIGTYHFNVLEGGTISSINTHFEFMRVININGTVDPDNSFTNCIFTDALEAMIQFTYNDQQVVIKNALFPGNDNIPTPHNISKVYNNGGAVYMMDAGGPFGDEMFENDPHDLIHWFTSTAGMWTGIVSSDWHTPGNWGNETVPDASVNVIIPANALNFPVVQGSTAVCNNLTVYAGAELTISASAGADAMLTTAGTANLNGAININGYFQVGNQKTAKLVAGNVNWGATADFGFFIPASIELTGSWTFAEGSSIDMGMSGVMFSGANNSTIFSHSANSQFGALGVNKTGGASVTVDQASTQALNIFGSLGIAAGTAFYALADIDYHLRGNVTNEGVFIFNGTTHLERTTGTQAIEVTPSSEFNNLVINCGGTATLSNDTKIYGDLTIQSGTFNPLDNKLTVYGNWINLAGPEYFIEGDGTVQFTKHINKGDNKSSNNYCLHSEHFNILEIFNPGGYFTINNPDAEVSCNHYNWVMGGIDVQAGSFTANNLTQEGLFGYYGLAEGGVINLSNYDGYVDLNGTLNISGGTFNVFGGTVASVWPYASNASIAMSGGILDFKNQGIHILPGYLLLTSDITGGTIRTVGNFRNFREDFEPESGTIELYGSASVTLHAVTPLRNVFIDKEASGKGSWLIAGYDRKTKTQITEPMRANMVTVESDLMVNDTLNVFSGTLKVEADLQITTNSSKVLENGVLWFEPGVDVRTWPQSQNLSVFGGAIKFMGDEMNPVTVNTITEDPHVNIYIGEGGTIAARNTHFSNLLFGVFVTSNAFVDTEHSFYNCTFEHGVDALLRIENSQDLVIHNAHFPTNSAPYNVQKTLDQGSITFINATGAFAGEEFEDDPYNRIHWVIPEAGLWIGAISSDWHTAGNWDDGNVPDEDTDVTIPVGTPNSPVVSDNAFCNHLALFDQLTLTGANILNLSGNLDVYGHLIIDNFNSLNVYGSVNWHENSTADVSGSFVVYGNWSFNEGSNALLLGGSVNFHGTDNSIIMSNSDASGFNHILVYKTGGADAQINNSEHPLIINGVLGIMSEGILRAYSDIPIILRGNLTNQGGFFDFEYGTVILDKPGEQLIQSNANCAFNNLVVNPLANAELEGDLSIRGDFTIQENSSFDAGNHTIQVMGDWKNEAGAGGFIAGDGRVIFNGVEQDQYIHGETNFNILEINKTTPPFESILIGFDNPPVTCSVMDFQMGYIYVYNGSVFNINSLAGESGIVGIYVSLGGIINLHNPGGSVDLNGEITVNAGGEFNVYGGTGNSAWGVDAFSLVYLFDGIIDFKDVGVHIPEDALPYFNYDITGGVIRVAGDFICELETFTPEAGALEMAGDQPAVLDVQAGSIWDLKINKSSGDKSGEGGTVSLASHLTVNDIEVSSGTLKILPDKSVQCNATYVFEGGTLWMEEGVDFRVKHARELSVNGGFLKVMGETGNMTAIGLNGTSGNYNFFIGNGGTIAARNAYFSDMIGINIINTGLIDPEHAFHNCTFENGFHFLLAINNNQDLVIHNAHFPSNSAPYNVQKTVDEGSVTFVNATGAFAGGQFENDPFNRIHWDFGTQLHTIELPAGWSGLSSYLLPMQPELETVFAPIQNELIIAQTLYEMYYPAQNINTIGSWYQELAMKVKTTQAVTLEIEGFTLDDPMFEYGQGWWLLPVLSDCEVDVEEMFSAHLQHLVILKDVAGAGVYWPAMGINTIGWLEPGKAYFMLMSGSGELEFPECMPSKQIPRKIPPSSTAFDPVKTPSSHSIAILPQALSGIDIGSYIGVFDQDGECFGISRVVQDALVLTVYGDDLLSAAKDGFMEGELMSFAIIDPVNSSKKWLKPTYDLNLPQHNNTFTINGLSAITGFKMITGIESDILLHSISIYPNPSNGIVHLAGLQAGVEVEIYDTYGQQIFSSQNILKETHAIDLSGYSAGIYFIKIKYNNDVVIKKLVLN